MRLDLAGDSNQPPLTSATSGSSVRVRRLGQLTLPSNGSAAGRMAEVGPPLVVLRRNDRSADRIITADIAVDAAAVADPVMRTGPCRCAE